MCAETTAGGQMSTHRIGESRCLDCGKVLDAASNAIGDGLPKPGDITICLDCGHIMVFDEHLKVRIPNDQEMFEMAGSKNLLLAQQALALMKAIKEKS